MNTINRIALSALGILILISCGNSNKLHIPNIAQIKVDYNHSQNINYGSTFAGNVVAIMHDGSEMDITNHRKLDINSAILDFNSKGSITVIGHPLSFNDATAICNFKIEDKNESFTDKDSLRLNYRGPILVTANGVDGEDGEDQGTRGQRLIGRDGKDGEPGGFGLSGGNGDSFTAHVWKDDNTLKVHLVNNASGVVWKYKTVNSEDLWFNISGGDGGDGGDGGSGSDGKDGVITEKGSKRPGNGGDAGSGGNGGNGGNGGSIDFILHPTAAHLSGSFTVRNGGGTGGNNGEPGNPGDGGNAASGQTPGLAGIRGVRGFDGVNGMPGPLPTYTTEEFDINQFQ